MNISNVDKRMAVVNRPPEDVRWFDILSEPFTLYGIHADEKGFYRLPDELSLSISGSLHYLSRETAGGRVRFSTNSPYVAIRAAFENRGNGNNMTPILSGGFDLYENGSLGSSRYVGTYRPPYGEDKNYVNVISVGGGEKMRDFTVYFPCYGTPVSLEIGLSDGCAVEKTTGYTDIKPVLYYGSSVTQGGCASRPGLAYQCFVSRRFNLDFINLGFSGNGLGEQAVADYMAGLDFSVFVSDYDHNAPSYDHLKNTHYRLYETVRKAHPDVPYIMISRLDEETWSDPIIRRDIIIDSYRKAVASGDKNVYYIDGLRVFDGEDHDNCTVDGCHPNDIGMQRMGSTLIAELEKIFK